MGNLSLDVYSTSDESAKDASLPDFTTSYESGWCFLLSTCRRRGRPKNNKICQKGLAAAKSLVPVLGLLYAHGVASAGCGVTLLTLTIVESKESLHPRSPRRWETLRSAWMFGSSDLHRPKS